MKTDANYPLYVFGMLWHIVFKEYGDLEYDVTYEKIMVDWKDFIHGGFNDPNAPLYECILKYLLDKKYKKE